jgi:hypothetical protein
MLSIARSMVPALLARHKGKFFSTTFVKTDGSVRTLNCHIGAVQGHDQLNPVAHIGKYVTVTTQENGKTAFKNINLETMSALNIAGNQYNVT